MLNSVWLNNNSDGLICISHLYLLYFFQDNIIKDSKLSQNTYLKKKKKDDVTNTNMSKNDAFWSEMSVQIIDLNDVRPHGGPLVSY